MPAQAQECTGTICKGCHTRYTLEQYGMLVQGCPVCYLIKTAMRVPVVEFAAPVDPYKPEIKK